MSEIVKAKHSAGCHNCGRQVYVGQWIRFKDSFPIACQMCDEDCRKRLFVQKIGGLPWYRKDTSIFSQGGWRVLDCETEEAADAIIALANKEV